MTGRYEEHRTLPNKAFEPTSYLGGSTPRWADFLVIMTAIDNMHECAYDGVHGIRVGSR
jgi:hypothetical protein